MFNWKRIDETYYGDEIVESFETCSLGEAVKNAGTEWGSEITTEGGTTVYEDGEWLMTPEEAEAIAFEEKQAEAEAKTAKETERKAEAATIDDKLDKVNIAFIMSVANKHPAKDSGARYTAEEIAKNKGWRNKHQSWRPTESDVIHVESGREYHIDMWKGVRKVTRTLLLS